MDQTFHYCLCFLCSICSSEKLLTDSANASSMPSMSFCKYHPLDGRFSLAWRNAALCPCVCSSSLSFFTANSSFVYKSSLTTLSQLDMSFSGPAQVFVGECWCSKFIDPCFLEFAHIEHTEQKEFRLQWVVIFRYKKYLPMMRICLFPLLSEWSWETNTIRIMR